MTGKRLSGSLKTSAIAGGIALALFCLLSWLFIGWDESEGRHWPGGTVIRDAKGDVLRVTLDEAGIDCRPTYAASREDWIVRAVVASEDSTFWTHCGVRPLSVLRAAWQNVTMRRRISGASTITMQAVRLMRPHPKTFLWKWREAVMAIKLERARDKAWIVSQYLNRAPFGGSFVGIEAAARGWFGKGAHDLGLGEAAMLAGMVQAPSRFRPDRHLDRALRRRDYVLGRMLALGLASPEQVAGAKDVVPQVVATPRPFRAPYFCDWILRTGSSASPGEIRTALDPDVQARCENAVGAAAKAGGFSVAAVVLRPALGRAAAQSCVALACSGDWFAAEAGQVNTALAPRPAGSTLKPFLTALALDRGLVTPETRLFDVPTSFKGYRPANFDARHRGRVSVRDALVLSLNVPFVQLLRQVGVSGFSDTLRALGLAHLGNDDAQYGLGLAIGNAEVTLVELASAYAAFARGGDGAFSPASAYLVSDMLSGPERAGAALGHVADVPLPRFAWKTGTSSAYRDAWTVLWNREWVVAVWCGHILGGFGDRTLVGAKAAAPVAWGIARQLCPGGRGAWFPAPAEVVTQRVCTLTGRPAGPECPETAEGRAIRGISPMTPCEAHRRGPDGKPVVREDAFVAAFSGALDRAAELAIAEPEADAVFRLVAGGLDQRIVCRPTGNPDGAALWWFADGHPVGESRGTEPFALTLSPGTHEITCTTAEGVTASVAITVRPAGSFCQQLSH